jgi:hypothetical protein
LNFYRRILEVRRSFIVPVLDEIRQGGCFEVLGDEAVIVTWSLHSGARLTLECNLSDAPAAGFPQVVDGLLWTEGSALSGLFAPWSVRWSLSGTDRD